MEIWKPVLQYEGRYEVSNLGRVKALERDEFMPWNGGTRVFKEKILRQFEKDNDYIFIRLSDGGGHDTQKSKYTHRLVWAAFHGAIPRGFIVNHKDKDRKNNALSNLELITQRDNCLHGMIGRQKTSKYPGVHKEARTGYWKAMARNGKKKVYIGKFDTEDLAYEAYKRYVSEIEITPMAYI